MHMFNLKIQTPIGFWLALISLGWGASAADESRADKPNVVVFLADDLGWTGLGCFGSDLYETPILDALAQSGVKFTNAYSACTVCSPTRAAMMTGIYPAKLHCTDFIAGQNRPFARLKIPDWTKRLDSKYTTIAEALNAAGYRTGHFGKWHLDDRASDSGDTKPEEQGFDVSVSRPAGTKGYRLPRGVQSRAGTTYLTDWLTDKACDFVNESEEPFFLYFAYNVPHTPIVGCKDLVQKFEGRIRSGSTHNNANYAAMVASLDESVGRVMESLLLKGHFDDTLIIFTSDNGGLTQRYGRHDGFTENIPLRRGKGSAYEGGVRVPTIVYWPNVTPEGAVADTPIITMDFYPTILEACGVVGDEAHNLLVDGKSLVPVLNSPELAIERNLFWHYPHYHAGGDGPYSAIRSGNYRLIEFHEDRSLRLFDLSKDIGERQDLADSQPAIKDRMHAALVKWRESVAAQMPTPNPDFDPDRANEVRRSR